jgi:hypothetical protein
MAEFVGAFSMESPCPLSEVVMTLGIESETNLIRLKCSVLTEGEKRVLAKYVSSSFDCVVDVDVTSQISFRHTNPDYAAVVIGLWVLAFFKKDADKHAEIERDDRKKELRICVQA